jgi:hypothetical protein
MRTLFAVALFATVVGGLMADEPKTFDSKEGKFSAKFPGKVESLEKTAGGLTLHLFHADFEKGKGGYLITYSDLPPAVLKAPQPEQVLLSSEKGLVDTFNAKVTKSGAIAFGPKKFPAREIIAERGDWNVRATIVLVGNRLYQVCVYGQKDFITSKEADAFFASFSITE